MPDLGPVSPPTEDAHIHLPADRHRRESGRALTLLLLVVAGVAVAGLGWALAEVLGISGSEDSGGIARVQAVGHEGAPSKLRADRAGRAGRYAGTSGLAAGERIAGLAGTGRLGELAEIDAGEQESEAEEESAEGLGGRTRFDVVNRSVEMGRRGRLGPASALAASGEVLDREGDPQDRPRIAPGYAEILGVIPLTPGFEAKLRRDWQILEYNGDGVDGTASLRELWDQPDLPDRVMLIALDPGTGEKVSVEVPPGPLGLLLAPAYERP